MIDANKKQVGSKVLGKPFVQEHANDIHEEVEKYIRGQHADSAMSQSLWEITISIQHNLKERLPRWR